MKYINKHWFIAICFFIGIGISQSQNQNWSIESPLVKINGTSVEINSIISKQGSNITWQQIGFNTNESYNYTINNSSGNWNNQNQHGNLIYELSTDSASASLEIIGTSDGIILKLRILVDNQSTEDEYEFITENGTNL